MSRDERFIHTVRSFYAAHARSFPWRETRDPYEILVSEFMLQQTQVNRVADVWDNFLLRFPTVNALASAPLKEVLRAWSGLGYNSRALRLRRLAAEVRDRHEGCIPGDMEGLAALPGVGPSTAGAVAAFAFGRAYPFVETNIRAVYLHHFFPEREAVSDREILPIVARTLDSEDPREWYYALMDYGSWLKREHPKLGRKTKGYRRQGPFVGSRREVRSRVLRCALDTPGITRSMLVERVAKECPAWDAGSVSDVIADLMREGILVLECSIVRIA